MRREAFESIEKLIGKNAFKLAVAEHVITASSAQRLQFLATVVLANKSQPNFLQVGLTPEGAMMMSQMVELQRKLMRKAVVHIFSQFRSYVASLPDIAVNRFISLSGIVNERDLYRVLTKEWGMYDPLARAAIRLVKASYEKLRNTPESAMPPSFAALPPAARLKEVIASVLSDWDKIDEMVATFREANGIDQLDILADLLFLQWRWVCEAFGVKKPVWKAPQSLQAVPASAAPADTTTVAQPADIGV